MEISNINNCFFHNIRKTRLLKTTDKFLSILSYNAILTQTSMKKNKIRFIKGLNCQGDDAVSICFHPCNITLYNRFFNKNTIKEDGAFEQFILEGDTPTIILNSSLIDNSKIQEIDHRRMPDEVQIVGDIPLTYMIGCGYSDKINKYLSLIKKAVESYELTPNEWIEIRSFLTYYEGNSTDVLATQYEEINKIKELLKEHGYNIPIVDVYNGHKYPNYETQKNKVHEGLSLIKEYNLRGKIYGNE